MGIFTTAEAGGDGACNRYQLQWEKKLHAYANLNSAVWKQRAPLTDSYYLASCVLCHNSDIGEHKTVMQNGQWHFTTISEMFAL